MRSSRGDAEPVRGTIALQQPTMDPVYPNLDKKSTLPAALGTADVLIQFPRRRRDEPAR
jgi:hypothetical protein